MRALTPRDIAFVTHSWLSNYRFSWFVKGVDSRTYFAQHHKVLEQIIPRSTLLVACDPEDPDTIYGWCCAEVINDALIFHYVYVKDAFKAHEDPATQGYSGFGVGKALVEMVLKNEDPRAIYYTHQTKQGRCFAERLYEKGVLPMPAVYDPYLLFRTLPGDWNWE